MRVPQRWAGCGSPWRSARRGSSWCNPDRRGPAGLHWRKSRLLLNWRSIQKYMTDSVTQCTTTDAVIYQQLWPLQWRPPQNSLEGPVCPSCRLWGTPCSPSQRHSLPSEQTSPAQTQTGFRVLTTKQPVDVSSVEKNLYLDHPKFTQTLVELLPWGGILWCQFYTRHKHAFHCIEFDRNRLLLPVGCPLCKCFCYSSWISLKIITVTLQIRFLII